MKIEAVFQKQKLELFWMVLLIFAGLCGNYFKYPIFLNIDFLFGSTFAMLALLFYGRWKGIYAGALIASYTFILWNHPYAIIIMTAEIAVVGYLFRRKNIGLVFADLLYWLFIGLPLVFLFYRLLMNASPANVEIIMVKQAINGITNAVIAYSIYSAIINRTHSRRIPLKGVITNQLIAFILFSSLAMLVLNSSQDYSDIDRSIRSALLNHKRQLQNYIQKWEEERLSTIIHLAEIAADETIPEMQFRLEQATKFDINFQGITLIDRNATSLAFFPKVDEFGKSNIGLNFASRPYLPVLKQSVKPMLTNVGISKTGKPKPRVAALMPIITSGEFNGYIAGILNLEMIQAMLNTNVKETGLYYTLLDNYRKVILTNRSDQPMMVPFSRGKGTIALIDDQVSQWIPILPSTTPASERWKESNYFVEDKVGLLGEWTLVLEQPVALYYQQLFSRYTNQFTMLALVLLIALAIAEWVSQKTLLSLEKLSRISKSLPKKLSTTGSNIIWPKSSILETQLLIDNYQEVSDSLAVQFNTIRETNETLEQRVAERTEALQESESRYERAINGVNDGIWEWKLSSDKYYISPRYKQLLGYKNNELPNVRKSFTSNIHSDDVARVRKVVYAHIEDHKPSPFEIELRLQCKNGEYRWFSLRGQAIWSEQEQSQIISGSITNISERKEAEKALAEVNEELNRNSEFLSRTNEMAKVGGWEFDVINNNHYWTRETYRIHEVDPSVELGLDMGISFYAPKVQLKILGAIEACIKNGEEYDLEVPFITATGRHLWVRTKGFAHTENDKVTRLRGSFQDVTEHHLAQEKVQLAASVFESSREGIMITEDDGTIIEVNGAFSNITGFMKEEVIGKNPRILSSGIQDKAFYVSMWLSLKEKGHWYGEIWNRRKDGEVYAEMLTITTVYSKDGGAIRYAALFSDITFIKEHEKQLEHIAHFDALTGLPNRVLLADRLHQAMSQVKRRKQKLAVVFLDIDGFKGVNDNYGHEAGDHLLIILASRMKEALREGDTLSRMGGDEFVAVLVDLERLEQSQPMLDRLLAAAAEPVLFEGARLQVSASIGVTFYPQEEGIDADQLQRQADQAMYQAKQNGKNRYHLFDEVQDRINRGHHESIERIRLAFNNNEFKLYYQPKVNMRTGKVVGAEALIRWQHPQNGLLAPADFLPVIENHVLCVSIGEWVIETALAQMEEWFKVGLDIPVSVNVGARQLQQSDFINRLRYILEKYPQVQANCLQIEVLETSALEDMRQISKIIEACSQMGVLFSLDDFGTGYSSLTYLKRLAVAELKIDQSFVRNMLDDPEDMAILEGVIGLANAFRLKVIAEGVETEEHGKMLLQLGCEMAQGYGIARPMLADKIPHWSATWESPLSWVDCSKYKHEDLPLLYAIVEHRAWVKSLNTYLEGQQGAPPNMNHHQCRFGIFMDKMLLNDPKSIARYTHINSLHRKAHELGDEFCVLSEGGEVEQVMSRMNELYSLRDELIYSLKQLLDHG